MEGLEIIPYPWPPRARTASTGERGVLPLSDWVGLSPAASPWVMSVWHPSTQGKVRVAAHSVLVAHTLSLWARKPSCMKWPCPSRHRGLLHLGSLNTGRSAGVWFLTRWHLGSELQEDRAFVNYVHCCVAGIGYITWCVVGLDMHWLHLYSSQVFC